MTAAPSGEFYRRKTISTHSSSIYAMASGSPAFYGEQFQEAAGRPLSLQAIALANTDIYIYQERLKHTQLIHDRRTARVLPAMQPCSFDRYLSARCVAYI